jgi:hypothetical protein
MPEFKIGVPITTDQSKVEVTITPDSALKPGKHVFTLTVEDDSGNVSANAAEFSVVIRDRELPTAVLDGPREVDFGKSFALSGERSSDAGGGRVVKYIFTLKE